MASNKTAMRRELLQALSRALKELRAEHPEITQEELAEQIGMDRSYWGDIERGERNITLVSLYQLAQGLGVTPLQLFMAVDRQYRAAQRKPDREGEIARLVAFADASPIMMWISGPRGECLHVNRAIEEYTGRAVAEILGEGWLEDVHPRDRRMHLSINAVAFSERAPYRDRYRYRKAGGDYGWVAQEAVPQFTSTGAFLGFLGTLIPIEEPEKR